MPCDHAKALDLAKAGQWDAAHETVQPYSDEFSCRIHGYLHRVEGDLGNAAYWYRRAGMELPKNSLEEESDCLYALLESAPQSSQGR
ncbi:MAG: hypothetical protein ACU837_03945 [Gammaproteobacteria bacterium]